MENGSSSRGLDVATGVMLGVISVTTALGAWQAAVWTLDAEQYLSDSADARSVSVNQAVLADYNRRLDLESTVDARRFRELANLSEPAEALILEFKVQAEIGLATPSLAEAWGAWAEAGFSDAQNPVDDPLYLAELVKRPDSYAYASTVMAGASELRRAQSGVLAQAALIQALALFLFGIAGVNRQQSVRSWVIVFGTVAFLAGVALAATAY
ncbi:MAG: hypothetical protein LH471_00210 [Salinibacterium sp.]|nr:hypothetical protein [Salinibacterium sp.]